VFDSAGTTAIAGATVTYMGADGFTTNSTTTDANGAYSFGVLPAQGYTVSVDASAQGYAFEGLSVTVTGGGNDTLPFNLAANTPSPTPTATPTPSPT
jgi:hypothetical protein